MDLPLDLGRGGVDGEVEDVVVGAFFYCGEACWSVVEVAVERCL